MGPPQAEAIDWVMRTRPTWREVFADDWVQSPRRDYRRPTARKGRLNPSVLLHSQRAALFDHHRTGRRGLKCLGRCRLYGDGVADCRMNKAGAFEQH